MLDDFAGQIAGPVAQVCLRPVARHQTKRLQRAGATVVRAAFVQPAAVETHEVTESPCFRTPRVIEESRAGQAQPLTCGIKRAFTRKPRHQAQSSRVIIRAISVAAVGCAET